MSVLCDEVLPEGVLREEGPPTKPPEDFQSGYVLPVHSEKPLQRLHRHPLDDRLVFFEKPHVYTFDGAPTSTSVTRSRTSSNTSSTAPGPWPAWMARNRPGRVEPWRMRGGHARGPWTPAAARLVWEDRRSR